MANEQPNPSAPPPDLCPHRVAFDSCPREVCRIAFRYRHATAEHPALRAAAALAALSEAVLELSRTRGAVEASARRRWAAEADHAFQEIERQRDEAIARAEKAEKALADERGARP